MHQTQNRYEPEPVEARMGSLVVVAPDGTPTHQQIWCLRLDELHYLATPPESAAAHYLEEDGRVCLLLGDAAAPASTITGNAVPVLSSDEREMVLTALAGRAPEATLVFRIATGPLVPPEVIEDPAERRLLVQSMFSNLPRPIAEAMAHQLHYETYQAGDVVVQQDTPADRFYIVVSGEAEVLEERHGVERLMIVLGPGESFGESALLLDTPRTATVRARTKLRVLALHRHTFEQVLLLSTEVDAE